MDEASIEKIDFSNHEQKCRICFKVFGVGEHRVEISKQIKKMFREVTQANVNNQTNILRSRYFSTNFFLKLQLESGQEFSRKLCITCSYQLTRFSQFRRNVINSQAELSKIVRKKKGTSEPISNEDLLEVVGEVKDEADKYLNESDESSSQPESPEIKQEINSEADRHQTNVRRRKMSGKTG